MAFSQHPTAARWVDFAPCKPQVVAAMSGTPQQFVKSSDRLVLHHVLSPSFCVAFTTPLPQAHMQLLAICINKELNLIEVAVTQLKCNPLHSYLREQSFGGSLKRESLCSVRVLVFC